MKEIEILVAVRNEPKNIPIFIEKIKQLNIEGIKLIVVFLEDGSTDNTLEVLRSASKKYDFVCYYSLENKLGQYVALFWGICKSKADAVITMDVDGGHPFHTLREIILKYQEGFDVVQGHRISYKSKEKYRAAASYLYNLFFFIFIGLNIVKQNSVFRLMNREAYRIFTKNSHWGYSLKTNFSKKDNIKTGYVSYSTPEREFGASKYNLKRLLALSIRVAVSQLTRIRFLAFIVILSAIIFLCLTKNLYTGAVLTFLIMLTFAIYFIKLNKVNPVAGINILETSNDKI